MKAGGLSDNGITITIHLLCHAAGPTVYDRVLLNVQHGLGKFQAPMLPDEADKLADLLKESARRAREEAAKGSK